LIKKLNHQSNSRMQLNSVLFLWNKH